VSDGNRVADTAPTAPVEAPWLQARAIVRVVFIALAVAATLWVLYALTGVLLLVVLAIFFAYLLAPLVEFACRPINVRGRARVLDSASFRASALQLLPRERWRWRGREFLEDMNRTLALYIRGQLIVCLLMGVVCTIGFSLIGLRYALLLGIVAGVLEFIPLVGPLAVALIAVLIAGFSSVTQAVAVALFLGILRIVEDFVVYPRIIGYGTQLHPLAVIVAVLCGAELAGVVGIFLAIPMAALMSVVYRHWLEPRKHEGLTDPLRRPP
jgi:predicted PurR-regulated permease PerM